MIGAKHKKDRRKIQKRWILIFLSEKATLRKKIETVNKTLYLLENPDLFSGKKLLRDKKLEYTRLKYKCLQDWLENYNTTCLI